MKRIFVLIAGVGLLAGCSALGSSQPTPQETTTVTVTATPAGAELPAECNAALDQADAAVAADSALTKDLPQVLAAVREAVAAAGRMDAAGVQAQAKTLQSIDTDAKIKAAQDAAAKYQEAVKKCRELRQ